MGADIGAVDEMGADILLGAVDEVGADEGKKRTTKNLGSTVERARDKCEE